MNWSEKGSSQTCAMASPTKNWRASAGGNGCIPSSYHAKESMSALGGKRTLLCVACRGEKHARSRKLSKGMNARQSRKLLFVFSGALLTMAASAAAIPPYPPVQQGSKVSTYQCGSDVMAFTERWNYSVSTRRSFEVLINGKSLSKADARRVAQEITSSGPFQSNFAVCTDRGFTLILMRYQYAEAQLHLRFRGSQLSWIGFSDESTGHKLIDRTSNR